MFAPPDTPGQVRRAAFFEPSRIVLAKGSSRTAARRKLVDRICAVYPQAEIIQAFETPHNRINLGQLDPLRLHDEGKQTLVLGEHESAVRYSSEEGNTCPNYWHFSPYGFCPYGCDYCYLAGTPGVRFSPTVKIHVNLPEILDEVGKVATRIGQPTAFYLGKLQDGMALDAISGYSRQLVPFFAEHPFARMIVLTKSADVTNLIDLDHQGHSVLSWTVNPPEIGDLFERRTPPCLERIEAMKRCAEAGYPVRAVVMPIIPVDDWRSIYVRFLRLLLSTVPLARITLGSICSYGHALHLTDLKLGQGNAISATIERGGAKAGDGRLRFARAVRQDVYRELLACIRAIRPDLEICLCLEEGATFTALDESRLIGQCNCVL